MRFPWTQRTSRDTDVKCDGVTRCLEPKLPGLRHSRIHGPSSESLGCGRGGAGVERDALYEMEMGVGIQFWYAVVHSASIQAEGESCMLVALA